MAPRHSSAVIYFIVVRKLGLTHFAGSSGINIYIDLLTQHSDGEGLFPALSVTSQDNNSRGQGVTPDNCVNVNFRYGDVLNTLRQGARHSSDNTGLA